MCDIADKLKDVKKGDLVTITFKAPRDSTTQIFSQDAIYVAYNNSLLLTSIVEVVSIVTPKPELAVGQRWKDSIGRTRKIVFVDDTSVLYEKGESVYRQVSTLNAFFDYTITLID